jgi:transposase
MGGLSPFSSCTIEREAKLLEIVKKLLREVDLEVATLVHEQGAKRRSSTSKATHPIASRLARMRGIGPTLAAVLATELFYRRFENRNALSIFYGATSQLLDFSGKAWISNRELYTRRRSLTSPSIPRD